MKKFSPHIHRQIFVLLMFLISVPLFCQQVEELIDDNGCTYSIGDFDLFQNGTHLGDASSLDFACKNQFSISFPFYHNCKFESNCGIQIKVVDGNGNKVYATQWIGSGIHPSRIKFSLGTVGTTGNIMNLKVQIRYGCIIPLTGVFVPHSISYKEVGSISLSNTSSLAYDFTRIRLVEPAQVMNASPLHVFPEMQNIEGLLVCCNQNDSRDVTYNTSIIHQFSSNSSTSATISSSVSISFSSGIFSFNLQPQIAEIETTTSSTMIRSGVSISNTFDPPNGINGNCVIPQFLVRKRLYYIDKYKIDCSGTPKLLVGQSEELWIPYEVVIATEGYVISTNNECDDLPTDVELHYDKIKTPDDGNKSFDGSNCLYNVFLDFEYNQDDGITVSWAGPNGYTGTGIVISAVEMGTYTYTITNKCCESTTGTVTLCDGEMEVTEWKLNEKTGEYCRTLTCKENPGRAIEDEGDCETIECVTPEIITTYQTNGCYETPYYNEEPLGPPVLVGVAETRVTYDVSDDVCIEKIFCGEDLMEESTEAPEWDYDNGKCIAICFGEEIEAEDIEPEIEEDFDENDFECTRVITCNGVEVVDEDYEPEEEDWEFDDWRFECVKLVSCGENSDDFEVTVDAEIDEWEFDKWDHECFTEIICNDEDTGITYTVDAEFDDWEYDESRDECVASVYCEDTDADIEYRDDPENYGDWDYGNNGCVRRIYCDGLNSYLLQIIDPDFDETDIPCPNSDGYYVEVSCDGEDMGLFNCDGFNIPTDRNNTFGFEGKQNILLYPNPFNHILLINGLDLIEGTKTLEMHSTLGVLIKSVNFQANVIDVSDVQPGVYMVKIKNNHDLLISKIFFKL